MGILEIAESNVEVQFMLWVILLAIAFLPFFRNLEGLLADFVPEKSHRMMSVIFSTLHYSALSVALATACYIYYLLSGTTATLTMA